MYRAPGSPLGAGNHRGLGDTRAWRPAHGTQTEPLQRPLRHHGLEGSTCQSAAGSLGVDLDERLVAPENHVKGDRPRVATAKRKLDEKQPPHGLGIGSDATASLHGIERRAERVGSARDRATHLVEHSVRIGLTQHIERLAALAAPVEAERTRERLDLLGIRTEHAQRSAAATDDLGGRERAIALARVACELRQREERASPKPLGIERPGKSEEFPRELTLALARGGIGDFLRENEVVERPHRIERLETIAPSVAGRIVRRVVRRVVRRARSLRGGGGAGGFRDAATRRRTEDSEAYGRACGKAPEEAAQATHAARHHHVDRGYEYCVRITHRHPSSSPRERAPPQAPRASRASRPGPARSHRRRPRDRGVRR